MIVRNFETDEHLTGPRIVAAKNAKAAGEKLSEWLDLEGFDITARIEVGKYVCEE